ncbi:MAG: hypothetical protein ACOZCO_16010 [Bacteroidota bacterium]
MKTIYYSFIFSVLLFSCSGGKNEKGKNSKEKEMVAVDIDFLEIDINNSDYEVMETPEPLVDIDFRNFSYPMENGDSVTITDGGFTAKDSLGFDSVSVVHESIRTHIGDKELKLVELERHYGFGSSNLVNYIFAFQKTENTLFLTGVLKYSPLKRSSFDAPVLILYPAHEKADNFPREVLVKTWIQVRQGNFEVIKSEKQGEK